MKIEPKLSLILPHLYFPPLHRSQDNLKNKMREQANKEEEMFTEVLTDANAFDFLLGKVTDTVQQIETAKETNKFLAPENKVKDYDFRGIESIYRKYPSALQLPVLSLCIS